MVIWPATHVQFWIHDIGAGRYLEAWVPANLIYDQFDLNIEIQLLNTAVQHTIITNGITTVLGINHWGNFFSRSVYCIIHFT